MISTHLGFGFEPSKSFKFLYADVAELADALASGASDRKVMWVQVPSSAPRMGKVFAALALLVTVSNVNSTCMFITHQPELPADSKKLRKF